TRSGAASCARPTGCASRSSRRPEPAPRPRAGAPAPAPGRERFQSVQSVRDGKGEHLQLVVNIAVLASIYALIACGYVLIYRTSRVLNLAHGELMMLAAYLLMATAALFGDEPLLALGVAALLGLLAGVLLYEF